MSDVLTGIPEEIYYDAEIPNKVHADWETHYRCVLYEEDGRITGVTSLILPHIRRQQIFGERIMIGVGHWDTHYVDGAASRIVAKTPCPAACEGTVLTNLPVPCQIEVNTPGHGDPTLYDWTEPDLVLEFDYAGTWSVRVLSLKHLPGEFTVRSNA